VEVASRVDCYFCKDQLYGGDEEKSSFSVVDDLIEWAEQFPYFGFLILDDELV